MNTLAHNFDHEKMNLKLVGIAGVAASSRSRRYIVGMVTEQGKRPRSMPAPSPYVFK